MTESEVRKAPRFRITLHVQITGVDAAPVLRAGDISSSGLFLELDRDVGKIGSMQRMSLSADDGSHEVVLLARVVRIASVEDFWKGRTVAGVALQFMFVEEPDVDPRRNTARPASESQHLHALLKYLVQRDAERHGVELQAWRGTARTAQGEHAVELQEMSPRGMAIETDYPVEVGGVIRLEMPASGTAPSRAPFSGEVMACAPVRAKPGQRERYRVLVRFPQADAVGRGRATSGESIDGAFEALLNAVTSLAPPPESALRTHHLAGELSRISLPSVLTLCQIERVTGVLSLKHGTSTIRAYVRQGDLVDAVVEGRDVNPRAALKEVIAWRDGSFEMTFEPVLRDNRMGMSTSALLIDLARELDEASR